MKRQTAIALAGVAGAVLVAGSVAVLAVVKSNEAEPQPTPTISQPVETVAPDFPNVPAPSEEAVLDEASVNVIDTIPALPVKWEAQYLDEYTLITDFAARIQEDGYTVRVSGNNYFEADNDQYLLRVGSGSEAPAAGIFAYEVIEKGIPDVFPTEIPLLTDDVVFDSYDIGSTTASEEQWYVNIYPEDQTTALDDVVQQFTEAGFSGGLNEETQSVQFANETYRVNVYQETGDNSLPQIAYIITRTAGN